MKSSRFSFFTPALIFVLALGLGACARETTTVDTRGTTDTATATWTDTAMTNTGASTADPSLASHPGQQAFTALRCQMCHAVSTAGVTGTTDTGGDLGGVSARRQGEDLAAFIQGDDHPGEWKGTAEQARQIAEWLGQQ
jgi:cytochrome c2